MEFYLFVLIGLFNFSGFDVACVQMVREIYSSVKQGKSIVKQMIMGAGKTTGDHCLTHAKYELLLKSFEKILTFPLCSRWSTVVSNAGGRSEFSHAGRAPSIA